MVDCILKVRPFAFHPSCSKQGVNTSGKVILPPSILQSIIDISENEILTNTAFTLIHNDKEIISVGVEEYSAQEGYIYLPRYIMEYYWLPINTEIMLHYSEPIKGNHISIEPHRTAFINSSAKEKAFLEDYLKKWYPVLKKGSTIMIREGIEEYYINIKMTLPADIISTRDTDLVVEFEKPLDYIEPPPPNIIEDIPMPKTHFVPFAGKGYRLGNS